MNTFEEHLKKLINTFGIDAELNMADYIVAKHMIRFKDQLRDLQTDLETYNTQPDSDFDNTDDEEALTSAGRGLDESYGGSDSL